MSSLFMLKTLLNAGFSENKDKIPTFAQPLGQKPHLKNSDGGKPPLQFFGAKFFRVQIFSFYVFVTINKIFT